MLTCSFTCLLTHSLTPWRNLLEKLLVFISRSGNSLHFIELEGWYCVCKSLLFVPVQCKINPVHGTLCCFFNVPFNIRLFIPKSSKCLFPSVFPIKTLYAFLFSPVCATCPYHLIVLDLIIHIIFLDGYKS